MGWAADGTGCPESGPAQVWGRGVRPVLGPNTPEPLFTPSDLDGWRLRSGKGGESGVHVRVLGIDPGSNATGWAVLDRLRGRYVLVDAGVVRTTTKDTVPRRLAIIHSGIEAVIAAHHPDGGAIETIFKHHSAESALRLGQARGVLLLVMAQAGLEIGEYNPMTVKKTVAGHGGAAKADVQRLVQRLLGLSAPLAQDAADAAAIAMTHHATAGLVRRAAAIAQAAGRPR